MLTSRQIDFTISNYSSKKIIKPALSTAKQSKPVEKKDDKNAKKTSFSIQKSFTPQVQGPIPESHKKILDPQIQALKKFANQQLQKQKKIEKLLATGAIEREDLIAKPKKQQPTQKQTIRIDIDGKLRDETGNLVYAKDNSKSLLINKNQAKQSKEKDFAKKQRKRFFDRIQKGKLHDANIFVSTNKKRVKRNLAGLQFLEQGSVAKLNLKTQDTELVENNDLNQLLEHKQDIQSKSVTKRKFRVNLQFKTLLPEKQWWDENLVMGQSYFEDFKQQGLSAEESIELHRQNLQKLKNEDYFIAKFKLENITSEVTQSKLFSEQEPQTVTMPIFLTKDERKKLKRRNKQIRLKQKHDKIKLGLLEPEKPKLKLSNMAIVMKDQFIMDPSRVQSEVRKQMQERLDKHIEHNASKKLTKQKKADKALRKLKRDSAKESRVVIFRIDTVQDRTHRFKIQMNAKQLAINGCFMLPCEGSQYKGPAIVIAEGGTKAIKFYKNLMLKRINWRETSKNNLFAKQEFQKEGAEEQLQNQKIMINNRCSLVWQAVINQNSFNKWRVVLLQNETDALKLLKERNVQHYWDTIMNYKEPV